MQAANKVIKNTGILYARMAITVFISLYSTRLILNALGVADYGIFNVVAGIIAMLTFLNNAMAGATQRFVSYAEGAGDFKKVKIIFNVSVLLHIIISIIVLIVLEAVGYYLFHGVLKIPSDRIDAAKTIYQFMIVSTLFAIISVPYDAIINAHENMFLVAFLGIIEALFKLGIALYISYTVYDKLTTYGLLTAISSIVLLIIHRIYCHKKYEECEIKLNKYYDKVVFKEMTKFASWSFLGSISTIISNYGQGIVMNIFFGTVVNAAQGIAAQVSGQLGALATTMLKALNPVLSKSEGGGNRNLMLKAATIGSKVGFFLLAILYIPVIIEMPYIFTVWLKTVPEYVIIFCRLLLIRNLFEQFGLTISSSITAVGNIRNFQIVSSIIGFLPLIASYVFFKTGMAPYYLYVSFLIYSLANLFSILFFAQKNCGLNIQDYFTKTLITCFASFLFAFLIAFLPTLILQQSFLRLVLICMIAVSVFSFSFYNISLSKIERLLVNNLSKAFLSKILKNSR